MYDLKMYDVRFMYDLTMYDVRFNNTTSRWSDGRF